MMPASYLKRHRPICDVLNEIKELAIRWDNKRLEVLCDEAITYAQSMSAKLAEYKAREQADAGNR